VSINPAYRKHKPLRKNSTNFIEHLKEYIHLVKLSNYSGRADYFDTLLAEIREIRASERRFYQKRERYLQ
jgi:hypothetical protein